MAKSLLLYQKKPEKLFLFITTILNSLELNLVKDFYWFYL